MVRDLTQESERTHECLRDATGVPEDVSFEEWGKRSDACVALRQTR